ncbi:hypothetical protein FRC12_006422, partial [Ceratobasidium sp. 428]
TIATRYKGKIYAWDVVNEVLNDDGTLRTSVWSTVLGESFISIAFKAARAADSAAKLYINDYTLEFVNAKTNAMVALVNRQKAAGTPIDGIGSQTHLEAGSAGSLQAALTKLATTGCDVAITELDIKGASSSDYTTAVKACLAVSTCVGISVWGVSDKDSWRAEFTHCCSTAIIRRSLHTRLLFQRCLDFITLFDRPGFASEEMYTLLSMYSNFAEIDKNLSRGEQDTIAINEGPQMRLLNCYSSGRYRGSD